MNRSIRLLAVFAVIALVAAGCSKSSTSGSGGSSASSGGSAEITKGGTLQLATQADVDRAWDPAKEYSQISFEFFRCCLTRTLLSTNGMPADQGGVDLQPDIAASMPEVSSDGLTWTFKLKPGIHYSPPFQDVEVTSEDFARTISRQSDSGASANGYPFYYSESGGTGCGIEGFDAAKGGPVSGVSTPDPQTLTIKLSAPCGDFGWRMAMPAMAPIPPVGDQPLGWATGHTKDYGRYLVGTGPYMFQGVDQLDPNGPPTQEPSSGYVPGRSWSLVRNPSWDASTDSLRPANVDGIEVAVGGTSQVLANEVDDGTIDFEYGGVPPAQQIQQYQSTGKGDQIHVDASPGNRYIGMNLAQPPFDDVSVRKAMNWIMDKDALRRARGGEMFGDLATHWFPPSLMPGQLDGYDPYPSDGGTGNIEQAKAAMMESKYDTNQDGLCDAPECKDVLMVTDNADPYPKQNAIIVDAAKKIGVELNVQSGDRYTFMYDKCLDPSSHAALCPSVGWFMDFPDPLTFGPPTLGSAAIGPGGCCNYSLVGASSELLRKAGYTVTSVPSLDAAFDECTPLTGDAYLPCWAGSDKKIMEEVVPVIPWLWDNNVALVGDRVQNYTFDGFAGIVAMDHLALAGGGAP